MNKNTLRSRIFYVLSQMNTIPNTLLKIGFLIISLFVSFLWIHLESMYLIDPTRARLIFEEAAPGLLISLTLLLGGTILLDQLFHKIS